MTNAKEHTIGLLQFEIQVNSEKNAIILQDEISHFCKIELPEILDSTLNKIDKKGTSLVIDKLEIDLGKIGFDDFKLKFLSILKKAFADKLVPLQIQSPDLLLEGKVIGKEETDFQIIESFLLTGNLPWYSNTSKVDIRRISKEMIRKKNADFIDLIRHYYRDKNFQNRLANIIPESLYKELFALFSNRIIWKEDTIFKQFLLLYRQFPFTNVPIKSFRLLLFEAIVEVLAQESSDENLYPETSVFKILAHKLQLSIAEFINISSLTLQKIKNSPGSFINTTQLKLLLHQLEIHSALKDEILVREEVKISSIDAENKISSHLVFNAGLVLVSPFLSELFNKLELLENGIFKNKQSQIKAIHLLQYAATAKSGAQEHSLLLNKILCGFPVNQSIQWFVNLNMKEKTEATRMLTALIKHWSVLKKTSASSFRTSFLQRNGILKKEEFGWKLHVESNAYDVLLSRIPWQFERIKLNWMSDEIMTIW